MLRVQSASNSHCFVHSAMATEFQFQLCGEDAQFLKQTAYEASMLLDRLEQKLSLYQEGSDGSQINAAAPGERVRISAETAECLAYALSAAGLFRGRFNPFVGRAAIRSKDQESEFGSLSSWDDKWTEPDAIIAFDPNAKTVEKLQAGHLLDLGAIGKGYALEQAAALLEEWDVEDGLISSGGSSLWLMKGSSPEAWKVELPSIEGDKAMPFHPGTAIASSGLSFQEEHIIDPASGRSETNWKRVHVAAPRSPLADAASTAAMLLDRSALSEVVEEEPSLSFLLVSDDGPSPLAIGDYFKPLIKDHA